MRSVFTVLLVSPGLSLAQTTAGETLPDSGEFFSFAYLAQVFFSLALVLGLLFGALWVTRRIRGAGHAVGGQMRVIASLALGHRERAVLINVGDQQILLGVAPGRVATLHVFDEPVMPMDSAAPNQVNFAEVWSNVMGKKGGSS